MLEAVGVKIRTISWYGDNVEFQIKNPYKDWTGIFAKSELERTAEEVRYYADNEMRRDWY